jgi:hypothetical protein
MRIELSNLDKLRFSRRRLPPEAKEIYWRDRLKQVGAGVLRLSAKGKNNTNTPRNPR